MGAPLTLTIGTGATGDCGCDCLYEVAVDLLIPECGAIKLGSPNAYLAGGRTPIPAASVGPVAGCTYQTPCDVVCLYELAKPDGTAFTPGPLGEPVGVTDTNGDPVLILDDNGDPAVDDSGNPIQQTVPADGVALLVTAKFACGRVKGTNCGNSKWGRYERPRTFTFTHYLSGECQAIDLPDDAHIIEEII